MLTRESLRFEWNNFGEPSKSFCSLPNGYNIGGIEYSVNGEWQPLSREGLIGGTVSESDDAKVIVEQKFVDFLNSVLPQDGYKKENDYKGMIRRIYLELYGIALEDLTKAERNILNILESESSDKADTKAEGDRERSDHPFHNHI